MAKTSKTLSAFQMAKRICERSDNIYDKKIFNRQVISNILSMYMDECRKALLDGEKDKIRQGWNDRTRNKSPYENIQPSHV